MELTKLLNIDPESSIVPFLLKKFQEKKTEFTVEEQGLWGTTSKALIISAIPDMAEEYQLQWGSACQLFLEQCLEQAQSLFPGVKERGTHFTDIQLVLQAELSKMLTGKGIYAEHLTDHEEADYLMETKGFISCVIGLKIGVAVSISKKDLIAQPYFGAMLLHHEPGKSSYLEGKYLYVYDCVEN